MQGVAPIIMCNHFCYYYANSSSYAHYLQIALNSMHKYIPCVIVSKFITRKKSEVVHVQEFPEAYFYAVTAYQNDQVIHGIKVSFFLIFKIGDTAKD